MKQQTCPTTMKERESWTQTDFEEYVNKSGVWTRCYSLFHQRSRSIDIPPPASCDALPGISGADYVIKKTAVVSEASAPVWRGDTEVPKNPSVLFIDQNREVFCVSATNSDTLDSLVFHLETAGGVRIIFVIKHLSASIRAARKL